MRLLDRRDTPLAIALIVGSATMFAQPLRAFLSVAEDVSRMYRIDLIPGLMIFVLVLTVHFWRKSRDAAVEVHRSASDAEQARRMADGMERLVNASHAIASALDFDALRAIAYTQLPPLLGPAPMWLAVKHQAAWRWLIEPQTGNDTMLDAMPALVRRVEAGPAVHDGWALFPLGAGKDAVGLLALHAGAAESADTRVRVSALTAVLGVAVRNVQLVAQLQTTCATDPLTGCVNRAFGFNALNSEVRRSRRTGAPLTVLMLDIDGFKLVNDQHGHVWGDRLLSAIGDTLQRTLRTSDVKCRYGGDEFLIILPDTPPDAAQLVIAHIRRALQQIELHAESGVIRCSVSIGAAAAKPGELDVVALVQRADAALYADKARLRLAPAADAEQGLAAEPARP